MEWGCPEGWRAHSPAASLGLALRRDACHFAEGALGTPFLLLILLEGGKKGQGGCGRRGSGEQHCPLPWAQSGTQGHRHRTWPCLPLAIGVRAQWLEWEGLAWNVATACPPRPHPPAPPPRLTHPLVPGPGRHPQGTVGYPSPCSNPWVPAGRAPSYRSNWSPAPQCEAPPRASLCPHPPGAQNTALHPSPLCPGLCRCCQGLEATPLSLAHGADPQIHVPGRPPLPQAGPASPRLPHCQVNPLQGRRLGAGLTPPTPGPTVWTLVECC